MKFLLFLSLFSTDFLFGQHQLSSGPRIGILTGTVQDSITKLPIDYASVRIFSLRDSSNVAQIYTDSKGFFKLEEIPAGKYYAKITYFGYITKAISGISFTTEIPGRDLAIIRISPEQAVGLEEVTVTAKQELLTNSLDKKVYNVGEDLSVKGGTVNDVLNNIPSVEVDQDGKISLRGDEKVTILIDGRPSTLAGGNGKSLLDALPSGSIERIEIVNNPSAKYDPDGTSGIINIVLKKNKLRGVNGNVALSAGTGNTYNGSASLSLRNSKINVYGTYAYRYYEGQRDRFGYMTNTIGDSVYRLNQDRTGTDLNITHTARLGADFYLKPRNTLGITLTGNFAERERTGTLFNEQLLNEDVPLKEWSRKSSDPSNTQNADVNLNYKLDFKEDKGLLTFDFTQSIGNDDTKGFYDESYQTVNGSPVYAPDLVQRLKNREQSHVSTFQSDFTHLLPKNMRVEAGAKAIVRQLSVNTFSETRDNATDIYLEDTLSNFRYSYDEQIYSLYGNFAQQIKKFKYQLGVRAEQASQAPALVSKNESFRNDYFNLFPSAYLKYNFTEKVELSLGYSKRINRPTSENLNPFTNYADPLNLMRGNPGLRPEYIHSFDLGFGFNRKKISLTASVYFRQTENVIQRVKLFYDNGTSTATFANIDESRSLGSEIVLVYRPFSWFKNMISLNGNRIQYVDDSQEIDWNNTGFNWGAKYAGTFEFWKKTASVQLNARYNSPIFTAQGKVQPRMSVDLSGEKSLKGGKWTVGFRLSDVFNTQEFRFEVEQGNNYQYSRFKQNTRRFYLNASYKFGKYEVSKKSKVSQDNGGGGDF